VMYVKTYDEPTIHHLAEAVPVRPLSTTSGTDEQRGYALYMRNCVTCHGPSRARIPYPQQIDFAHFRAAVRAGTNEMPAFTESALPPESIEFLAAYLRDPAAGEANASSESSRIPPPTGQARFYGQFGFIFRAKNGLPAFSPPWSSIVAYDLNKGTILWRRPIGTTPGLAAQGITDTGSSDLIRNGPVVTAGGVLFLASGPDRMVHALDKDTGKTLWEMQIDANPDGIPAVYEVNGREYVAFYAAASGAKETMSYSPGKPGAQGYYVFALQEGKGEP
jgi:quinoprotein glucose dehydrogenase